MLECTSPTVHYDREMGTRRRLDTRYAIEFPVQLVHGKHTHSLLTGDVSEGGVFLRTDAPPPLMQLVQVQLVLPIGGRALVAHAMTVHVVPKDAAPGRVPGIGVQLYALDRPTRDAWEAFTRHVAEHCPESRDQTPLRLQRGLTPEPLSRRFLAHKAVLVLRPSSLDALEALHAEEVRSGQILVPSEAVLPAGTVVVVHIVHPDDQTPHLLQATVAGRSAEPRGLYVAPVRHGALSHAEFLDFIGRSIRIDDESVVSGHEDTSSGDPTGPEGR